MLRFSIVAALGLALAGCANQSPADKGPPPEQLVQPPAMDSSVAVVQYHCADGTAFTVRFDDAANTATIAGIAKSPVVLPQQITADGFDYRNGDYDLRGKGDEAMWKAGNKPAVKCSAGKQ
jgi:membrane-bound inhibitor of C-type lysozyme